LTGRRPRAIRDGARANGARESVTETRVDRKMRSSS
jgi:hypothetical protein